MIEEHKLQALRELCFGASIFSEEVLNWIAKENLWNLWVPKNYGGLELSFIEGLLKLQEVAKIDGSLGWTLTLCSGANYFIGNLAPETADEIFSQPKAGVCFGGSGGVFGTAEKRGDKYRLSGKWRYATGAPYLTHFTLNAEIYENGQQVLNNDGSPKVRSFVLPREEVEIIEDWNTMGLKASATHSFTVENALVHERFSFKYNEFHQPQDIFKIPFSVFADLTLWVNYIGMAQHFLEEARHNLQSKEILKNLKGSISISNQKTVNYSTSIEDKIENEVKITSEFMEEIHKTASNSVKDISRNIIEVYPSLGVKASRENEQLNQIFCDYFTATQHHIFTK